jgi:hypothetical protein
MSVNLPSTARIEFEFKDMVDAMTMADLMKSCCHFMESHGFPKTEAKWEPRVHGPGTVIRVMIIGRKNP